jgi:hypothetical protein
VDEDRISMLVGKTDYLCTSSIVHVPAWRAAFSMKGRRFCR